MRQRQEVQALSRQAVVRRCPHAHVVRCPRGGGQLPWGGPAEADRRRAMSAPRRL
nr:hypothetical protein [Burkholderia ubonensis]